MAKSKSDTKKYILFILIIAIVFSSMGYGAYYILGKSDNQNNEIQRTTTNEIEGYGYTLDDLDTPLYKTEFEALKENLTGAKNEEEYAKSLAKLFIIDLYTINNKLNKYDVGGVEFVYPDVKENYILNVDDTIYNYVEDNSQGNRKQNLPEVVSIEVKSINAKKYKINSENVEYDGYVVKLSWNYHVDYGYDTEGEVVIIKKDDKLYIVEKN